MMKFAKHISLSHRLMLLLLWSFVISHISQVRLLVGLNLALWLLLLGQMAFYGKNPLLYLKRWLKLNLFSLAILATLSWQITPQGIAFSPQGALLALILVLRFNLFILSLWAVIIQSPPQQLQYAISELPLPAKLKDLIILTLRYIFLLSEINQQIALAMKARGFKAGFNSRSLFIFSQRIALLLILALNRAEQANLALKARGFYARNNQQNK